MAESSLTLSYSQIYALVGSYLGVGTTVPNADSATDAAIDGCIQSGLRMFYAPPAVKSDKPHVWSFLRLTTTINTMANVQGYTLPDDFAQLADDPVYPGTTDGNGTPNRPTRIAQLFDLELNRVANAETMPGPPVYCSLRALSTDGTAGQRFKLELYPTPDSAYVVTIAYITIPNKISTTALYALGGGMHSETILQACLAVAEQRVNDGATKHHQERFLQLLEQSIRLDQEFQRASDGSAWPLDGVSQGVPVTYRQYLMRVGHFLRYGRDPQNWSHGELHTADSAVQEGYRRFCYPPPTAKGEPPHAWSFLQPVGQLALTSGTTLYNLPADFASLLGDPTYSADGTNPDDTPDRPTRMAVITDLQCRAALAGNSRSAPPLYCSIVPSLSNSSAKQAWQLRVYPTPDASYTVSFQYLTMPPHLSLAAPFPVGGELHGETLLEAMLAAAESQNIDVSAPDQPEKPAPQAHYNLFLAYLAQSIRIDKQNQATTADSPWPVFPTPSGITLHYRELLSQVGEFLGFGWDSTGWSHEEFQLSDTTVQEGYRKFLYPKPHDPKNGLVYEWSFLLPEITITTASGQSDYPLPAYFADMNGDFAFTDPHVGYATVKQVSLGQIRRMQGEVITSGIPSVFCITPTNAVASYGTNEPAYSVTFFPTPDATYSFIGRVKAVPPRLSDDNPFPMGGPQHAETVRTACLMAAEIRYIKMKPPMPFGRGRRVWIRRPSLDEFNDRLAASIGLDTKLKPDRLGSYGGGRSGGYRDSAWHDPWAAEVTYQGNSF